MDNNKKLYALLIILFGIVLLGVIIYFIFFHDFSKKPVVNNPEVEQTIAKLQGKNLPATTSPIAQTADKPLVNPIKKPEDSAKKLAMSFAERFGSYSNQDAYAHLRDLKIFMTDKMSAWADKYIQDEMAKKVKANEYYGINTRSAAAEIKSIDEAAGNAEIIISTIRQETANKDAKSFQQKITIKLIKENGIWKVDSALWQK